MMDCIDSIDKLIKRLENCTKKDYPTIPKSLSLKPSDFSDFVYFSEEEYTRNCIARNDDFELLLLCWEPGQETPIHCHDSQECWVVMIDGSLEEEKFEYDIEHQILIPQENSILDSKIIAYMSDDLGYHLLRNHTKKRAVSLHLYVNPIDKCSTISRETGKIEWIETEYHTYEGELV